MTISILCKKSPRCLTKSSYQKDTVYRYGDRFYNPSIVVVNGENVVEELHKAKKEAKEKKKLSSEKMFYFRYDMDPEVSPEMAMGIAEEYFKAKAEAAEAFHQCEQYRLKLRSAVRILSHHLEHN